MPSLHDSYLLKKLKEGEKSAFDAFFRKYYKLLIANAFFYLKDEQEAKDVVQDFLFDFWDKRLYERLEGDMKGYLYRSVQNRCYNLRKRRILEEREAGFLALETQVSECGAEEHEEELTQLEEAFEKLPQQRKEALMRVYLEEKKYQEAADEIGISLNTLKTHLKIGLKNLREKLKKN